MLQVLPVVTVLPHPVEFPPHAGSIKMPVVGACCCLLGGPIPQTYRHAAEVRCSSTELPKYQSGIHLPLGTQEQDAIVE